MNAISLSAFDLGLAALGVVLLSGITWLMRLGLAKGLLIAGLRTVVQLLLVGLVLRTLFDNASLVSVSLISLVMVLLAGREVGARQRLRFRGWRGYVLGTSSMFASSFAVTVLALLVVIGPEPWYAPRYAIPLLGMIRSRSQPNRQLIPVGLIPLSQKLMRSRAC